MRPSRVPTAVPGSRLAPVKVATNGSAGAVTSSAAVPVWRSLPVDDDADRVGERRGVLEVVRDDDRGKIEVAEMLVELEADGRLRVGVER